MTDDEFFAATDQLKLIYRWARVRRVAPWALFGAVLLRVSASTPLPVQLPGVIGGRVSLNAFCAFVSRSGGGKGISDKVARLAWPTEIEVRLPGSGEGISEPFVLRGKESEDNERLTAYILTANEIDTLTGLASRQGSILMAQLKSAWMGEPIGQSNASKATSRHVAEHDYRLCLSVGAQPGHCQVIFADTSGGSPQRFWWMPTEDPDMPRGGGPDPAPLNTALPAWTYGPDGVAEIAYGIPEIEETVIDAHLARQRGQADAIDGHALLSRLKIAALLAIMHQRQTVTGEDWALSESVMAVSNRTRDGLLEYDRQAQRAKVHDRAIARAVGDEVYDGRLLDGVKRSILRTLERDGEQAGNVLRSRMGKRDRRDLFDQAVALLEHEGMVVSTSVDRGVRYRLSGVQGEPPVQGTYQQVSKGEPKVQGEPSATVTDLDSRRSHDSEPERPSARDWFNNHVHSLRNQGHDTVDAFAVYSAGMALDYKENTLKAIASDSELIHMLRREGRSAVWCLHRDTCDHPPVRTAGQWLIAWAPANLVSGGLPQADVVAAGAAEPEEYSEAAVVRAKQLCKQVASTGVGRGARWVWVADSDTDSEVTA